jgi:hypothetical protein
MPEPLLSQPQAFALSLDVGAENLAHIHISVARWTWPKALWPKPHILIYSGLGYGQNIKPGSEVWRRDCYCR